MPKPFISRAIIMGDSASDRGEMRATPFIGRLAFIGRGAPQRGRFANKFNWADIFASALYNKYLIHSHRSQSQVCLDHADVSDSIITRRLSSALTLSSPYRVTFENIDLVRTYCVGGLTSVDYSQLSRISKLGYSLLHPILGATRELLSNLTIQRGKILSDDAGNIVSDKIKAQTLIIEWSGANDLVTTNTRPTTDAADLAIAARLANIRTLVTNGYRNFRIFNLPNLADCPRFRKLEKSELENADHISEYFNQKLALEVAILEGILKTEYPDCNIQVFDVCDSFQGIKRRFESVEAAKFRAEHGVEPTPKELETRVNKRLFWDDIHITSEAHAKLAGYFYSHFEKDYEFSSSTREPAPIDEVSIASCRLMVTSWLKTTSDDHSSPTETVSISLSSPVAHPD
ncbi:MAG: hypothetical protein KBD64_02670 [Gammaproteobacteria bacterium]|nr:hypothetical protein [Gammaproteobacteria bacterium]